MTDLLRFALVGLGTGAIYSLLALGLVLIYRGSGVVNFAQSGFALAGGFVSYELQVEQGASAPAAVAGAVVVGAALGLVTQLVLRPLRGASPLARVIATLALLSIITELALLRYGANQVLSPPVLPTDPVQLTSEIRIGAYALWLTGIATVLTVALVLTASRTRFGLAVSAAAESPRAARALGWSPNLLSTVTWTLGGALGGLAGALFSSITFGFVAPVSYGILVVGALAAALLAQFKSYPLALAGGLGIGALQMVTADLTSAIGVADSVPFMVIVAVLVLRGQGLPLRGTIGDRMPRVGTGRVRPLLLVPLASAFTVFVATAMPEDWLAPLIVTASTALIGVSIVILTGYTGQLSIAQFALAGVGAFAAGQLSDDHGWSFEASVVVGVAAAGLVGLLFGLPALRTRGVNLAVVTFGLGFALYVLVFSRPSWTRADPGDLTLFGLDLDPLTHPRRYAVVCVVAVALAGLMVAHLRRARTGRRLLAVRTNERAAASIGVSVFEAKLYAFALSAAVAGLGGVLLAFSYGSISYSSLFGSGASIQVLLLSVIGGVGYIAGPILASVATPGGLLTVATPRNNAVGITDPGWEQYLPIIVAVALIVTLILNQDGVAGAIAKASSRRRERKVGRSSGDDTASEAKRPIEKVASHHLEVTGLTQRFGAFTALDDVDLVVRPGEIVGLLGPNGAGKTTLVDCVAGNNRPSAGRVGWDDHDVTRWSPHRRARAGLARTFQSLELFDDLTVRENLLAAAEGRSRSAYLTDLFRPGKPVLPPAAEVAVAELELGPVLDVNAEDLSYGQRRLVAIARAVAAGPSVLLLDEPTAGLDEHESAELGRLMRRLADDWGMGILLIEHDVALVLGVADRVVVLDFGKVIAEGEPATIEADPVVRRAYLGEVDDSAEPTRR